MKATERLSQLSRERGKALVRQVHLSELEAAGAARALALHEAEQQLDRVARVLPDALRAGVPLAEAARVTGVSRQTLYELKTRYDAGGSTELAVLELLATQSPITFDSLVAELERTNTDVQSVGRRLLEEGLVQTAVAPAEFGGDTYLSLTDDGTRRLEHWWAMGEDKGETP